MPSGVLKTWFEDKGYGFITPDYGRSGVFVHRHGWLQSTFLTVGTAVMYEVEYSTEKRPYLAVRVRVQGQSKTPPSDQRQSAGQGSTAPCSCACSLGSQEPPFTVCMEY